MMGPNIHLDGITEADLNHFQNLELTPEEERTRDFHRYLRMHTTKTSGYTVDLRKAMRAVIIDGEHPADVSNSDAVIQALDAFVEFRNKTTGEQ